MKAISPVIATVIIVAVAIAISIAVALWITGLTSSFTGVEKLEIVNAYAEYNAATDSWTVHIKIKNTGTKAATIDGIFINNKPGNLDNANIDTGSWTLNPGTEAEITFSLNGPSGTATAIVDDTFTSGQTVSIVIHTASGGQYPASVTLP